MLSVIAQTQNENVSGTETNGLSEEEIRELTKPLENPIENTLIPNVSSKPIIDDVLVRPDLELTPPVVPDMYIQIWPKGSRLPRWATGYMYGYNGQSNSLLYGYRAIAGAGISQALGEYWTVTGGLALNKYSIYYNMATFDGSLTWHPNPYFSTTVFGSYGRSFLSPMKIGSSFEWGGFVTVQTDTDLPFGVDAGVRNGYDPMTGHWSAPIIQPFVKLGDAKLGIDFGPMIQDAIWRANHKGYESGPGVVPRPVKNLPAVVPRR